MTNAQLADLLEAAASRLRKESPRGDRGTLKTEKEMASTLGISWRHLQNLRRDRVIPCVLLGKSVRYNPEAVERAVEKLTIREIGHGRKK